MEECKCQNWCRCDPLGHPRTNHHPNCEHVDESLIDVWRVHEKGEKGGCYFDDRVFAQEMADDEEAEDQPVAVEITQEKMHREVYERMAEFEGF